MATTSRPSIAVVLPGEAMWGAFQTGFALQLAEQLHGAGYGNQPFELAVGSSSGSLVATIAAAGGPHDHRLARSGWIEFAKAMRFWRALPGKGWNPYPRALAGIFEQGLIKTEQAFHSRTQIVVAASHYNRDSMAGLRERGLPLLVRGLELLLTGPSETSGERLAEQAVDLLETGARLFAPRYFTTKPWRPDQVEEGEEWIIVEDAAGLRQAVEASSRIPIVLGAPISQGAHLLIDGVFANNAPVEPALKSGARHVFVVTSSRKGHVFDRPVQSMVRRQLRAFLRQTEETARRLDPLPRGRRLRAALREISRLHTLVPPPAPLDLETLRGRYPGQEIHVVHPQKAPPVNRFFESDPAVLGTIYDMGRRAAETYRNLSG